MVSPISVKLVTSNVRKYKMGLCVVSCFYPVYIIIGGLSYIMTPNVDVYKNIETHS